MGRGWVGILLQFGVPNVFHSVPIKFSIDYRPKVQEILNFSILVIQIFIKLKKLILKRKISWVARSHSGQQATLV